MSASLTYRLIDGPRIDMAVAAVKSAPKGYVVEIREPTRNLDQNAALHAALTDIAEQVKWKGLAFSVDVWKRLCMASFLREIGHKPELIPALDGNGFDVIYERTSKMPRKQFSEFLEWVYAFGAQNGCVFRSNR